MSSFELCPVSEYQNHLPERLQVEALAIKGIYIATVRFRNSDAKKIAARFPVLVQDITMTTEGTAYVDSAYLNDDYRPGDTEAHTPILDGILSFKGDRLGFPLVRKSTGITELVEMQDAYLRNSVDPLDEEFKTISTSLDLLTFELQS